MTERNWTPYQIEIILHHSGSRKVFPGSDVPEYRITALDLVKRDLLRLDEGYFTTTPFGDVLVQMWLNTPLPRRVFIDPRDGKEVEVETALKIPEKQETAAEPPDPGVAGQRHAVVCVPGYQVVGLPGSINDMTAQAHPRSVQPKGYTAKIVGRTAAGDTRTIWMTDLGQDKFGNFVSEFTDGSSIMSNCVYDPKRSAKERYAADKKFLLENFGIVDFEVYPPPEGAAL